MFTVETLDFLRELSENNSRAWFTDHKARYERHVKGAAAACVEILSAELGRATGQVQSGKVFRINRDLRFSKDKTPYNTHIHISFTPQQDAPTRPSWMLGLSPEYFTLGCGAFAFGKPGLERFRARIDGPEGAHIGAVLEQLADDGVRLSEPELKRVPPPFDKAHPRADLLRRKGLVGWIDAKGPEAGIGPSALDHAMAAYARLRPLYDLLMLS